MESGPERHLLANVEVSLTQSQSERVAHTPTSSIVPYIALANDLNFFTISLISAVVTCPKLSAPRYGSVRVSSNNVGGKADYSCNKGFVLVGSRWRRCQANGWWSGKAPTCRRKK